MALWGFKWLKFFLNPFGDDDFDHISEDDRRAYIIHRLETAKFSEYSWVVVVAGVGFFTDAYSIFAVNMVLPILGIVYYGGTVPHRYETALSVVTLGGSIIGQVAFGLGADLWGRRKMYGLELLITIFATLGVVMASNGVEGSMSLMVWLLVWRFVLGIGIGADYPLSAVICSEFAPTRIRGKMLTMVFACQPLGQLAATLVALIAAVHQRNGIPADAYTDSCNAECKKTLDSIWRWVIGVGVIPAVIALWFRLTIIESPRYTADVGGDTAKAASELKRYMLGSQQAALESSLSMGTNNIGYELPILRRSTSSGARSDASRVKPFPLQTLSRRSSGVVSVTPPDNALDQQDSQHIRRTSSGAVSIESGARSDDGRPSHDIPTEQHHLMQPDQVVPSGSSTASPRHLNARSSQVSPAFAAKEDTSFAPGLYQDDPGVDPNLNRLSQHSSGQQSSPSPVQGFPGLSTIEQPGGNIDDNKQPPPPSWEDFKGYFWHQGNLRTLIATSVCWFCLDLPFYGLGMNSPRIITKIWYGAHQPRENIYTLLIDDVYQSLIVVSLGAMVGIIITFFTIDRLGRKWIQMIGFFWLFILFIIIGTSFYHLYEIGGQAAIVVLYILCQIFFNFGPNATTYILPAELFPTRYRALCHGISAAFGKLGSVVAQLFLAYINYGHGIDYNVIEKWLPYSLLIFSSLMALGLYTTIIYIPPDFSPPKRQIKTLEQHAKGRPDPRDYSLTAWGKVVVSIWRGVGWLGGGMMRGVRWLGGDRGDGGVEGRAKRRGRGREVR